MRIDAIDTRILDILREDGRIANNEIAARLSVSEGTVRNRIRKLLESRFLCVRGLVNPDLDQDRGIIFILVKATLTRDRDGIARQIAELPGVRSVCLLAGRFDFLIETFMEPDRLIQLIGEQLAGIESIISLESLMCLRSYNKWI